VQAEPQGGGIGALGGVKALVARVARQVPLLARDAADHGPPPFRNESGIN